MAKEKERQKRHEDKQPAGTSYHQNYWASKTPEERKARNAKIRACQIAREAKWTPERRAEEARKRQAYKLKYKLKKKEEKKKEKAEKDEEDQDSAPAKKPKK